jgi:hypothetical protein
MSTPERKSLLEEMIRQRTDFKGNPLPGYAKSVEMARAELAELESKNAAK